MKRELKELGLKEDGKKKRHEIKYKMWEKRCQTAKNVLYRAFNGKES